MYIYIQRDVVKNSIIFASEQLTRLCLVYYRTIVIKSDLFHIAIPFPQQVLKYIKFMGRDYEREKK